MSQFSSATSPLCNIFCTYSRLHRSQDTLARFNSTAICSFGNRFLIFAILILSNKKLHLLCKVKDEPEITLINELSNYLAVFIVLFFIKFVSFEIKTKLKLAQKENMGNYYFKNDAVAYVLASRKFCHNWDYSHILNDFHIFLRKEYYWS